MTDFLSHYLRLEPPTWVFLSTFLTVGLFLMFHRFWSLRNLDILLILLFTPGLMLVYEGSSRVSNPRSFAQIPYHGPSSKHDSAVVKASVIENRVIQSEVHETLSRQALAIGMAPANQRESDRNGPNELAVAATIPVSVTTGASAAIPDAIADELNGEVQVVDTKKLGRSLLYSGYLWLIIASSLLVIRMLLDTAIVRRPMLDPNLSSGGMLFLGISMLVYLLANVAVSKPTSLRTDAPSSGPGYILMTTLPDITTVPLNSTGEVGNGVSAEKVAPNPSKFKLLLARSIAIGANLAIVASIVAIGYWHFGNLKTGVGAATFYLLLPYTVYMTGRLDHVLPAALLLLAVLLYRQPFAAGLCLGLAAGVVYYPFSLLPLWCSFYWQRGIRRFSGGFITSIVALVIAMVILQPENTVQNLGYMFGVKQIAWTGMDGIWGLGWYPALRLPLILLFILLSISFVAWPAQKSLATLMSCSAALMAATQCWHGFGGGLYLAWFIPLALLTIFRPNLDYCVALEVIRPYRRKGPKTLGPGAGAAASAVPENSGTASSGA